MARDIEDFLRKAAERRAQAQRGGQGGGQGGGPQQPAPRPAYQPTQVPRRSSREQTSQATDPVSAEIVEADRDSLQNHRQSESSYYEERPSDDAQKQVAQDIHEKFDHQLGSLSSNEPNKIANASIQVSPEDRFAKQLVDMLRQPASLRAAIILKEVLERPNHSW